MLIFIKTRNVYLDKKSKKKKSNKKEPTAKYKLASLQSIISKGHYFFIIASDKPTNIPEDCVIEIYQRDWERKLSNHLPNICSYIDLINTEFISYFDIQQKMFDRENRFSNIGIIKKTKFNELSGLYKKILNDNIIKSKRRKRILLRATMSADKEHLKSLGLKYIE